MKNAKSKYRAVACFLVENGHTVLQVLIFAVAFLKAIAESERRTKQ
jgi:hypothetical protein